MGLVVFSFLVLVWQVEVYHFPSENIHSLTYFLLLVGAIKRSDQQIHAEKERLYREAIAGKKCLSEEDLISFSATYVLHCVSLVHYQGLLPLKSLHV